jgi:TonB-linked SusC/RagA family outer membrane protein
MKRLLLMLLLIVGCAELFAQPARITGKVTDATTGLPVEGATVRLKNAKTTAAVSTDGSFTILAKKGDVLVITSVGYANKEVTVGDADLNIALDVTTKSLTDVVVVGYGRQKKANLTGSVAVLKNEDLTRRQVASTSNLLQGLVPGVTVQQQSGRPGADGASIRIRGLSSIYAGQSPLILVDGVVSSLDAIDPNAIDNISIFKDAASTAIYGARAANGVVLITTKRAKSKGLKVAYNAFVSKQVATAIPKRVSAIEHMELSNVAERNRTGNPAAFLYPQSLIDRYKTTPANNLDIIDTDWLDLLLTNNGVMQNHNVTLTSGGERVNVFTSVTFLNQQGLIPNNSFTKYDIRFNPDFKISDKLTLSGVFNYNSSKSVVPSTGSPEFIIRQAIGLPAIGGGRYGPGKYGTAGQTNNRNPLAMAESAGTSFVETGSFLSKVALNFHPIKNLEIEAYWAREQWIPRAKTFVKNVDIYQPNLVTNDYDKIGVWPGTTSLGESYSTNTRKTYLAQATYSFKLRDHSFKVLAGGQTEEFTNNGISASRTGFINPDQPYLNLGSGNINNAGSAFENALAGVYGRLNYNYKEKYLLELNGRYDGSSRFSQALNNQWGFFPSASAGWLFSKEDFFKGGIAKAIQYGKLRGSIGSLGNQSLSDNYPFAVNYGATIYSNPNNGTSTYFNNTTTLGYALLDAANPDITWETSQQWNIGLELGFANHFNLTADYYVRNLKDILLLRPIPNYVGLNSPFINAGTMENKGWELALNYNRKFNKLKVDVTVMVSDVVNKVKTLPGLPFLDGGAVRTAPGQSLFSYFGYQSLGYFSDSNDIKGSPVQFGVPWSPTTANGPKPGDLKYRDINGDGKVDVNDRTFIGNDFPRYEYSINLNLSYGRFDLNIFGQGVGKRNNYLSGTGAVPFNSADFAASLLDIHKDYWTPENRNADFPRLLPAGSGGNNFVTSTQWIRSAAFFRIKNVNLAYNLPDKWLQKVKISSARIYISGSNLLTFTNSWDGFDPEINSANAQFYPLMRTYTAGVNVNF